jgi:predicted transcriptional regulator
MSASNDFGTLGEKQRFLEAIQAGMEDLARGESFSDEEVKAELESEFGVLKEQDEVSHLDEVPTT